MLHELEDVGEVKLAITHHSLTASGDSWKVDAEKALVFVLDQPKLMETGAKKGKKAKRAGYTMKNFGGILNIGKMKDARRFVTGWRARLENSTNGVKTLVPIRPIACLSGVLDLGETYIRIF